MAHARARVYCEDCEQWLPVDTEAERARCDCGRMFVVTVTPLSVGPA